MSNITKEEFEKKTAEIKANGEEKTCEITLIEYGNKVTCVIKGRQLDLISMIASTMKENADFRKMVYQAMAMEAGEALAERRGVSTSQEGFNKNKIEELLAKQKKGLVN